jgi:WD40 repeat protein
MCFNMKSIRTLLISTAILISFLFVNNLSISANGETELPVHTTLPIRNATDVTFSPDGKLMFTEDYGSRSYIWYMGSGISKELKELFSQYILGVAFSPDSKVLAVSTYHQIWLFDSQSGDLLNTIEDENYNGLGIFPRSLSFSNDGKLLIVNLDLSHENRISIINMASLQESLGIPISGYIEWIRTHPIRNEFATASNSILQIRNAGTGDIIKSQEILYSIFDMNYSHDGRYFIVSYKSYEKSGSIIFDVQEGYEQIAELEDYGSVSFSKDSKLAVIGNKVYLVEEQFKKSYDIKVQNSDQQVASEIALLSPDGKYIVTRLYEQYYDDYAELTILDAKKLSVRLTDILIDPSSISLGVSDSQILDLMGTYSDGTKKLLNSKEVKWSVQDFYIAEVQESTLFSRSFGSTTLTAKYGNLTTTIKVIVADAPSDLKATSSGESIKLHWTAVKTTENLLGYNLYRRKTNENYNTTPITDFPIKTNEYKNATIIRDQDYFYVVKAIYKDQIESQASAEILVTPNSKQITLQVDNPYMTVNGEMKEVDNGNGTSPIILNGRTLLRALIEELGGTIIWSNTERKLILQLANSKIELWIDQNKAIVNGNEKELDVAPTIINERTMIPLRFVTDNLGLELHWEPETNSITITYQ